MARNEHNHVAKHGAQESRATFNLPTNVAPAMPSEEDLLADVDEPPDLERTPRPSGLKLLYSFKSAFSKSAPRCERKESLLTSALHSDNSSPVEEQPANGLSRGMSCASTWSNNSASTAELTSDGGFTSPGTRTSTPSPPLPPSSFMVPIFNKPVEQQLVAVVRHDDENIGPLQKVPSPSSGEQSVEVGLGRKRCITFACDSKIPRKAEVEQPKPAPVPQQTSTTEPPKRVSTVKFACPTKVSTDAPSKGNKPHVARAVSPAPMAQPLRSSPVAPPKPHRDSDSTVRNPSPEAMRKPAEDRIRRLSANSDLARSEAYRFHEFASSEEEVEEWTQESTCHRRPLTIKDTLMIENNLRRLGEEAEEEAVEEEENLDEGDDEEVELDEDEDDIDEEADDDDSDAHDDESDEGFQTDDEEGFAGSDDESEAGSDYNWWAPGHSTAATSIEHLELIRPSSRRSMSESSVGSVESVHRYRPGKLVKRRKSRPVNIRIPSPELPDSTDFVCGTLDEDRPLEEAYMSALERRRAAKHKKTPQDVDPTFPTSDPEMDEEDEYDEVENVASESDQYFVVHGQMDPPDGDLRGRRRSVNNRRSPMQSPKRLRSPPPAKRSVHRSPPPQKLFGHSPRRLRSPAAPLRLRSPPPTRRGSSNILSPRRPGMTIQFAGLAERPALTTSSSLPRTPISTHPPDYEDDEDTPHELPVRRAIDIKVGLEKKRQRRKEQLYKKMHRKGTKEKRPAPGKGCERMREVGLGLAAHKGKATAFAFHVPPTPDQKDIHILSL